MNRYNSFGNDGTGNVIDEAHGHYSRPACVPGMVFCAASPLIHSRPTTAGVVMTFVVNQIRPILIVCGLLTCSMVTLFVAPQAALTLMFGASVEGQLALHLARNFGAMITLFGAALVYCAWRPGYRPIILVLAIAGKLLFIITTIALGGSFLRHAAVAVGADVIMITLFAAYLYAYRRNSEAL